MNRSRSDSLKRRIVEIACDISNRLRDVPEISVPELIERLPDSTLLLDVRPESERAVSIIPGAVSLQQFEQLDPDALPEYVVTYCTAGYRSGVEARKLRKSGVESLNLRGGLLAWCEAEQPLVTPENVPTRRVHVYGKAWNLVPDSYEAVW